MFITSSDQPLKDKRWALFVIMLLAGIILTLTVTSTFARKGRPAPSANCATSAEADWAGGFSATAQSTGGCGAATLELSVSNANGDTIWRDSGPSEQFFGFDDATSSDAMSDALALWVRDYVSTTTTGTLPDWPAGEDIPVPSEFPFYVDEEMSRERYLAIRAADRTMICYIQGRESMRCLSPTENGSRLESIGVQSFPG